MLVPNGPKERIEYVIKTYRETKNRRIIPEAITVSLALLGFDQASRNFDLSYSPLWHYLWSDDPGRLIGEMRSDGYLVDVDYDMRPSDGEIEAYVSDVFDRMPATIEMMAPGVNNPSPRAFLVPWVARELGRLNKAVRRGNADEKDYEDAVELLKRKAPAIAMWAERERVDMNKMSLAEAIEALQQYEFEMGEGVPQGTIVYDFGDGWTMQDLRTEESLEAEGEEMQHCVGGYCDAVRSGRSLIYSLRDPRGNPHATIELKPQWKTAEWERLIHEVGGTIEGRLIWGEPTRLIDSPLMKGLKFEQIRGKQNEMPVPKYRERLQQFINDKLYSDPLGLLMVVMPDQTISFRGHEVRETDFTNDIAWEGVPLEQADWSGGYFEECLWPELEEASFAEAEISESQFQGELFDCFFDSASLHDVKFEDSLKDCDFENAKLSQVIFAGHETTGMEVFRCTFRGSSWFNSSLQGTSVSDSDFSDVMLSSSSWIDVDFHRVELSGLTLKQSVLLRDLKLQDLDLTDVSHRVITELLEGTGEDPYRLADQAHTMGIELPDDYEPPDSTMTANTLR